MKKLFWATTALALSTFCIKPASALVPLPIEGGGFGVDNTSIEDLKAIRNSGSFEAPPLAKQILGYDPSRTWNAGDRPEDVLKIGDLQYYGLLNLSLDGIAKRQGTTFDKEGVALNQVGLLEGQSIKDLSKAIPKFKSLKVKEVAPLYDLLGKQFGNKTIANILDRKANELAIETRAEASKEVVQYANKQIDLATVEINTYLEDNLTQVELNIGSLIAESAPELGDSSQLLLREGTTVIKTKVTNLLSLEIEKTKQDINNFISKNQDLAQNEIDSFINQQLGEYQNSATKILNDITQTTYGEVAKSLNLSIEKLIDNPQSAISEALTSQVNQYIEQSIDELKSVAKTYIDETYEQVGAKIEAVVEEQLGSVGNIAGSQITKKIGEIELSQYDLSQYSASDVPGIESTPIDKFAKSENLSISQVPGAKSLDFNQYPKLPNFGIGYAQVDLVLSEAEGYAERAISGSDVDGFFYTTCRTDNNLNGGCAHIELGGPIETNRGKQWITGDSQNTNGGHGILKPVNGGKEPTGRLPFLKSPFKMVLRTTNEQTDEVELALAFRYGFVDMFGNEHWTPYSLFEIPIFTFKVSDYIFLGVSF